MSGNEDLNKYNKILTKHITTNVKLRSRFYNENKHFKHVLNTKQ